MRVIIDATPDELAEKSEALIQALAHELADVAPDLAEALEKALPKSSVKMLQPALEDIHEITRKAYAERLKWMMVDIGKVLNRAVMKKAEGDEPGEEKEELEPGDINPETGEEVPEKEEEPEEDEEGEEENDA